jgi:hypothetical protein
MKEKIITLIEDNNIVTGVIFILIAILVVLYQLKKNESFKMKDHSIFTWKVFVNTWVIVLILLMFGLFLIFKY